MGDAILQGRVSLHQNKQWACDPVLQLLSPGPKHYKNRGRSRLGVVMAVYGSFLFLFLISGPYCHLSSPCSFCKGSHSKAAP